MFGNNSSKVLGIQGAVDHDVFMGTEAELRAHLGLPSDAPTMGPLIYALPDLDAANDTDPDAA